MRDLVVPAVVIAACGGILSIVITLASVQEIDANSVRSGPYSTLRTIATISESYVAVDEFQARGNSLRVYLEATATDDDGGLDTDSVMIPIPGDVGDILIKADVSPNGGTTYFAAIDSNGPLEWRFTPDASGNYSGLLDGLQLQTGEWVKLYIRGTYTKDDNAVALTVLNYDDDLTGTQGGAVPSVPGSLGYGYHYERDTALDAGTPNYVDINAALGGRNARLGWFSCDGPGDCEVAISEDGANHGDTITLESGETMSLDNFSIDKLTLECASGTTGYRLLAR